MSSKKGENKKTSKQIEKENGKKKKILIKHSKLSKSKEDQLDIENQFLKSFDSDLGESIENELDYDESDEPEEILYEVESIQNHRGTGKKREYFIKWKGYSEKDNTWEPLDHLENVLFMVESYEDGLRGQPSSSKKQLKIKLNKSLINENKSQKNKKRRVSEVESQQNIEIEGQEYQIKKSFQELKNYLQVDDKINKDVEYKQKLKEINLLNNSKNKIFDKDCEIKQNNNPQLQKPNDQQTPNNNIIDVKSFNIKEKSYQIIKNPQSINNEQVSENKISALQYALNINSLASRTEQIKSDSMNIQPLFDNNESLLDKLKIKTIIDAKQIQILQNSQSKIINQHKSNDISVKNNQELHSIKQTDNLKNIINQIKDQNSMKQQQIQNKINVQLNQLIENTKFNNNEIIQQNKQQNVDSSYLIIKENQELFDLLKLEQDQIRKELQKFDNEIDSINELESNIDLNSKKLKNKIFSIKDDLDLYKFFTIQQVKQKKKKIEEQMIKQIQKKIELDVQEELCILDFQHIYEASQSIDYLIFQKKISFKRKQIDEKTEQIQENIQNLKDISDSQMQNIQEEHQKQQDLQINQDSIQTTNKQISIYNIDDFNKVTQLEENKINDDLQCQQIQISLQEKEQQKLDDEIIPEQNQFTETIDIQENKFTLSQVFDSDQIINQKQENNQYVSNISNEQQVTENNQQQIENNNHNIQEQLMLEVQEEIDFKNNLNSQSSFLIIQENDLNPECIETNNKQNELIMNEEKELQNSDKMIKEIFVFENIEKTEQQQNLESQPISQNTEELKIQTNQIQILSIQNDQKSESFLDLQLNQTKNCQQTQDIQSIQKIDQLDSTSQIILEQNQQQQKSSSQETQSQTLQQQQSQSASTQVNQPSTNSQIIDAKAAVEINLSLNQNLTQENNMKSQSQYDEIKQKEQCEIDTPKQQEIENQKLQDSQDSKKSEIEKEVTTNKVNEGTESRSKSPIQIEQKESDKNEGNFKSQSINQNDKTSSNGTNSSSSSESYQKDQSTHKKSNLHSIHHSRADKHRDRSKEKHKKRVRFSKSRSRSRSSSSRSRSRSHNRRSDSQYYDKQRSKYKPRHHDKERHYHSSSSSPSSQRDNDENTLKKANSQKDDYYNKEKKKSCLKQNSRIESYKKHTQNYSREDDYKKRTDKEDNTSTKQQKDNNKPQLLNLSKSQSYTQNENIQISKEHSSKFQTKTDIYYSPRQNKFGNKDYYDDKQSSKQLQDKNKQTIQSERYQKEQKQIASNLLEQKSLPKKISVDIPTNIKIPQNQSIKQTLNNSLKNQTQSNSPQANSSSIFISDSPPKQSQIENRDRNSQQIQPFSSAKQNESKEASNFQKFSNLIQNERPLSKTEVPKLQMKQNSNNKAQSQHHTQPQKLPQTQPQTQHQPQSQSQLQLQNSHQPQSKPQPQNLPQPQNQPQLQTQLQPQPKPQSQLKQQTQIQPQTQLQLLTQPQIQHQPQSQSKQQPQNQHQPQLQPQLQPLPQNLPEPQPQTLPQTLSQPLPQTLPQHQPQNQQQPQSQPKQQLQNQHQPQLNNLLQPMPLPLSQIQPDLLHQHPLQTEQQLQTQSQSQPQLEIQPQLQSKIDQQQQNSKQTENIHNQSDHLNKQLKTTETILQNYENRQTQKSQIKTSYNHISIIAPPPLTNENMKPKQSIKDPRLQQKMLSQEQKMQQQEQKMQQQEQKLIHFKDSIKKLRETISQFTDIGCTKLDQPDQILSHMYFNSQLYFKVSWKPRKDNNIQMQPTFIEYLKIQESYSNLFNQYMLHKLSNQIIKFR